MSTALTIESIARDIALARKDPNIVSSLLRHSEVGPLSVQFAVV